MERKNNAKLSRSMRRKIGVSVLGVMAVAAIAIPLCALATSGKDSTATSPTEYIEGTAATERTAAQIVIEESTTTTAMEPEAPALTYWEEIPLNAPLQDYIVRQCEKANIRPAVVFAMIWRESNYKVDAIGDNGNSYGLMQIQPKWNYQRMIDLGYTDLLNAFDNVTVGIDILAEKVAQYDGDVIKALVAYNAGSYKGTVTDYALAVMQEAERLDAYVLHG